MQMHLIPGSLRLVPVRASICPCLQGSDNRPAAKACAASDHTFPACRTPLMAGQWCSCSSRSTCLPVCAS